jgi:hypothetical protein
MGAFFCVILHKVLYRLHFQYSPIFGIASLYYFQVVSALSIAYLFFSWTKK